VASRRSVRIKLEVLVGECAFKQDGEKLIGSCAGDPPGSAPVPLVGNEGQKCDISNTRRDSEGVTVTFFGQLDDLETSVKGSLHFVDEDGNKGGGKFTARKE
jgi:hypothetical protein